MIRQNGAEWKMNHLRELLVREYDYNSHKDRFDEADIQLQYLITKYQSLKYGRQLLFTNSSK